MNVIACVSKDFGIGFMGDLLFRIPKDLKFFKEKTLNRYVVMGFETFKSLPGGKALPHRTNLILSRKKDLTLENALVFGGREQFFSYIKDNNISKEDIFICGGETIYKEFLPYCSRAFITKVSLKKTADRFFPNIDNLDNWCICQESEAFAFEKFKYTMVTYINTAPKKMF